MMPTHAKALQHMLMRVEVRMMVRSKCGCKRKTAPERDPPFGVCGTAQPRPCDTKGYALDQAPDHARACGGAVVLIHEADL